MILLPVAVDVPMQRYPIANWVIMTIATLYSFSLFFGRDYPWETAGYWKDDPMFGATMFQSMFAHADIVHLVGNMIFLWVFGNAVNAKLGNLLYTAFYLACTFGTFFFTFYATPVVGFRRARSSRAVSSSLEWLLYSPHVLPSGPRMTRPPSPASETRR